MTLLPRKYNLPEPAFAINTFVSYIGSDDKFAAREWRIVGMQLYCDVDLQYHVAYDLVDDDLNTRHGIEEERIYDLSRLKALGAQIEPLVGSIDPERQMALRAVHSTLAELEQQVIFRIRNIEALMKELQNVG